MHHHTHTHCKFNMNNLWLHEFKRILVLYFSCACCFFPVYIVFIFLAPYLGFTYFGHDIDICQALHDALFVLHVSDCMTGLILSPE